MMREIKFKVWHKELKEMFWFDLMWGRSGRGGSGWISVVRIGEERKDDVFLGDNTIDVDPNECVFLQYTGKKDNRQKEIYDEDVIRFNFKTSASNHSFIGRVFMDEYMWCVETTEGEIFSLNRIHNVEIIGNFYENPELLKQEAQ
jgi:uncharacterized phage protein (TIGR01671 family)